MKRDLKFPKSEWGPGPWQEEPDRVEFEHRGFSCLMRRNTEVTGAWCGYVAVPPGHPAFEKNYEDVDVNVHGGLTYASHCRGEICHVPNPGEPDNVWWLGLDFAHGFDLMPRMRVLMDAVVGKPPEWLDQGHYWTMDEVRKEVKKLAGQLAAMGDL